MKTVGNILMQCLSDDNFSAYIVNKKVREKKGKKGKFMVYFTEILD